MIRLAKVIPYIKFNMLPKSIRKFIRKKKAELRKIFNDEEKVQEELRKILKEKFNLDFKN